MSDISSTILCVISNKGRRLSDFFHCRFSNDWLAISPCKMTTRHVQVTERIQHEYCCYGDKESTYNTNNVLKLINFCLNLHS